MTNIDPKRVATTTAASTRAAKTFLIILPGYSFLEVNHLAVMRPAHRGSRFLTGFGLGGLAGLGLGVLGATTCHGMGDACDGSIVIIPAIALLGGVVGGLAGYLSGYSWDAIPTAKR